MNRIVLHVMKVLPLLAASMLPVCAGDWQAQAIGPDSQSAPEAPGLLFDPQHQRRLSSTDSTVTIKLIEKGDKLSLDVQRRGSSAATQVGLPEDMAQANEIRRVGPGKAVVIGMFSGDVWEVAVVDLDRPSLSDKFLCYEPAIAPNGRYISFIKFFPAHFAEGVEDHYMLYDLRKSAAQNRPAGTSSDDWQTVGTTVYPAGIGNHDFDNLRRPESSVHILYSDGFFWNSSGDQFLFADEFQGQVSVILIDLSLDGKATTKISAVPPDACGEKVGPNDNCALRLVGVVFGLGTNRQLTLTFRGTARRIGLKRELVFDPERFSTLGSTTI
jgi:hypothetical protein